VKREDFLEARKKLGKTQKQLAELLGASTKAVQGYEQGWRAIPPHVERQVYFLLSRRRDRKSKGPSSCWTIKKCPLSQRRQCPAWEFQAGQMCWFINGTICECRAQKNWQEKMVICRGCEVLAGLIEREE